MRSISLIILLSLFYILRLVDADPRGHLDMDLTAIEGGRADDQNGLAFSTTWHVLGPFKIGTRESTWGADPLELHGGFRSLQYDPNAQFRSSLGTAGTVQWSTLSVDDPETSKSRAKVIVDVGFPDVDWDFIQSIYGWAALQYQAWARGDLQISGLGPQTIALFADGLLELWVDSNQYFGGDFYAYRRSPIILRLDPGSHAIDLRLVRDVRALGGIGQPRITVNMEAYRTAEQLGVDTGSLVVSEVVEGRLASPLASINVRNDMGKWVEVLWIKPINQSSHDLILKESHFKMAPYQSRPLTFDITLTDSSLLTFAVEIAYKTEFQDEISTTPPFMINLTSIPLHEAQKFTFLHPSGIVSYAVIRPPPANATCVSGEQKLPILLNLHGAGVETDSDAVRQTLDDAYGFCAWILFPGGVTSWSGDDWHSWGAADVRAAIEAIPNWIQSVAWTGPGVFQDKWFVTGHSNGGQGTWFLLTHHPDKIIAAAPVSGYSSIDNYVPFVMWRESEPLLASILKLALSSFKHELLVDNLAGIPILQQHGSKDDNVPAYHSRLMANLISETGFPSEYHELVGKGHWFDGVMTTPTLVEFYGRYLEAADDPLLPVNFSITVPTSGDMNSRGAIMVDQLQSPDVYGNIQVSREITERIWYLKTRNIHRFHLVPAELQEMPQSPVRLVIDGSEAHFSVRSDEAEETWYVRADNGDWNISRDDSWRSLSQRYGRQVGSMDSFLRSTGRFTVFSCSPDLDEIALQLSRNLFQYFAADSQVVWGCVGDAYQGDGNVVTIAVGKELPSSKLGTFPIQLGEDSLSLWTKCGWGYPGTKLTSRQLALGLDLPLDLCEHRYGSAEEGLGAVFLRPLEGERLELVIWGVDEIGVRQAARLVPMLTGVGQPDFVVLSGSCRWKGHAGAYAAGFLDHSWQISRASYLT